jgi:hypothetical protein
MHGESVTTRSPALAKGFRYCGNAVNPPTLTRQALYWASRRA